MGAAWYFGDCGQHPGRQDDRAGLWREFVDNLFDGDQAAARGQQASFCTPSNPHSCTLPCRSARCAWMTVTSGLIAGTAASCSPLNGHSMVFTVSVTVGRSVPRYPRNTANGRPEAPAT